MGISTTHEAISSAQAILEAVAREAAIAKAISEGDRRLTSLDDFNRQNILRTQLVKAVWQRIGRQVLAMHPAVVEEVRIASSDKIPGEVLRTLPYMNPLVVYADPPTFKSWVHAKDVHRLTGRQEDSMRLLGFFTYGTAMVQTAGPGGKVGVEQRIYPTTSVEADRFGVMLLIEVLDTAGKVIDLELNSVTVFFAKEATLKETVDDLMSRFHWDDEDPTATRARVKWMRDVLSVVMGSLFYLCSTTLEAEEVPRKAVAKRIPKALSRKPLSLFKVGWTTGAALTRYRQHRAATWQESQQGDLAHQRDPEHRRGHFKMQPCGPRNTLRKLIYVSPYWTHVERLGEEGVNTARAVPRPNGTGAAREAVETAMNF